MSHSELAVSKNFNQMVYILLHQMAALRKGSGQSKEKKKTANYIKWPHH